MRRRKHRQPLASFDQINVTPLLDLTFLLLIAFMLTMPLMEYGTSVTPPEMNAKKLPEKQFKSVTIAADGSISYQRETVTRETLMEQVWNYGGYGDVRAVDVAVRRLREKIEDDPAEPQFILTRRGAGYVFGG